MCVLCVFKDGVNQLSSSKMSSHGNTLGNWEVRGKRSSIIHFAAKLGRPNFAVHTCWRGHAEAPLLRPSGNAAQFRPRFIFAQGVCFSLPSPLLQLFLVCFLPLTHTSLGLFSWIDFQDKKECKKICGFPVGIFSPWVGS